SYALISYLNKEKGYDKVSEFFRKLSEADEHALLCVINLGEIYYHGLRAGGKNKAELALNIIKALPINIIEANINLTLQAAEYKAFNKISYADAYAAALTKLKKGQLITGDKEFKTLEKEIKIIWI
ncbi:MAG: type II toxin-antitoxin system VapC family toxin, partial [Ignavibacteriaceae bacterium]